MKRWIPFALAGLLGALVAAPARGHDPDLEMKAFLEAKLKQPWIKAGGFTADYDQAQETALNSGKPIFAYFTISYREVPPCTEVEKGVLATPEFRKFGEGVVPFVHVTSGLDGKYADLLREKGGSGVPAFMVLDELGNVLAKVSGAHDVANFERTVKSGLEYAALRKKADKTRDETVEVLVRDMDLGNLKLVRARELAAKSGEIPEAQRKRVDDAMLRLEIWTAASGAGESLDRAIAAGKLFAGMWAAGREPSTEEHVEPFFRLMLDHAEAIRDAKLFRRALDGLRDRFSEKPGWGPFAKWQEKRLAALEAAGDGAEEKGAGGAR